MLKDVTIGITSFLRHGYLQTALNGIYKNFPECSLIVADDSNVTPLIYPGTLTDLPFDSGLPAKRNQIVRECKTKYLLMGQEDFVYDQEARAGVEKLVGVLDAKHACVDVAAGRVNHNPYEGHIEYTVGSHLREIRLKEDTPGVEENWRKRVFYPVELTANYFVAKTDQILPWNEQMKIGGEHVVWFLDMKLACRRVAYVPGVNINTQPFDPAKQDPRYRQFRARAWDGHEKMKEILNIRKYIDFNGHVS